MEASTKEACWKEMMHSHDTHLPMEKGHLNIHMA